MNYFEHGKVQPHRGNMQTQIYVVLYTVAWYKKNGISLKFCHMPQENASRKRKFRMSLSRAKI